MMARAAEANPSCFSPSPLSDVEQTLAPAYIRLVKFPFRRKHPFTYTVVQSKYFDNHWGLTKFCVAQFKGVHVNVRKADAKRFRETLSRSKRYDDMEEIVGSWTGEDELREIIRAIEARSSMGHILHEYPNEKWEVDDSEEEPSSTPTGTQNPESPGSGAPFQPSFERMPIPAMVAGHDAPTPTPGGGIIMAVM